MPLYFRKLSCYFQTFADFKSVCFWLIYVLQNTCAGQRRCFAHLTKSVYWMPALLRADGHKWSNKTSWCGDDEISSHAKVVVGGEPVIGGEPIARNTQDFIETAQIGAALTGKNRDPIGADHSHRPAVETIVLKYALSRSNGVGRGVLLHTTDVDIHLCC